MSEVEIAVLGVARLRELAARIRVEGRKDLARQMASAISKGIDPLRDSIRASAAETMPRRGGYNATFTKSLRFRTSQGGSGDSARVSLASYGDGQSERRDIRALEAGRLRHPVFGRSRAGARKGERVANPWAVTSIRAGFWKRGTEGAMDESVKALDHVLEEFTRRLAG